MLPYYVQKEQFLNEKEEEPQVRRISLQLDSSSIFITENHQGKDTINQQHHTPAEKSDHPICSNNFDALMMGTSDSLKTEGLTTPKPNLPPQINDMMLERIIHEKNYIEQ